MFHQSILISFLVIKNNLNKFAKKWILMKNIKIWEGRKSLCHKRGRRIRKQIIQLSDKCKKSIDKDRKIK